MPHRWSEDQAWTRLGVSEWKLEDICSVENEKEGARAALILKS